MRKRKNKYSLPILLKGMVFALLLMFFSTSCCITGYCQIDTTDSQQKEIEETIKQ
ncbi:hypothetical protein [Dysgonomonas sp. Marseille-P4361]|uniref:hypothetical protein n=1 Tax=Dysgonomonas sp. Marseille-P4361 TaxID=2161820 RepID=UPI00135C1567|nr:hypothetical protein [Dysgonomonas sp. Marseille-P4361]